MPKKIVIGELVSEISFALSSYNKEKTEEIKRCTEEEMERLVVNTKNEANVLTGKYRDSIASKVLEEKPTKKIMVWYVKDPKYRLSHLLNDGHRTKSGGRTKGNNFISKNANEVIDNYVERVERILSD